MKEKIMIRNVIITALTVLLVCVSGFAAALYTGEIVRNHPTLNAEQQAAAASLANWNGQ
jgi:hypothetical protein